MNRELIERIERRSLEEGILYDGMRLVVGVSGGADSVFLLRVLCYFREKYHLFLTAVHVNHGIRGEEALADQNYVEMLCREWKVPCVVFDENVPQIAKEKKETLEEAGRNIRCQRFEEVRRNCRADAVAVAHHMDDQAETVLMNLLRGSGICGAAGMHLKREGMIRPLLGVRKSEIEKVLTEEGIAWRVDRTNSETEYFRNRVRNCLLPLLEKEYNAEAVRHIAAFAEDLGKIQDRMEKTADRMIFQTEEAPEKRKSREQNPESEACEENILQGEACKESISESEACKKQISKQELLEKKQSRECLAEKDDSGESLRRQILSVIRKPSPMILLSALSEAPEALKPFLVRRAVELTGSGLKDLSRKHILAVLDLVKKTGNASADLPRGVKARLEYDRIVFERETGEERAHFCVCFRIFPCDRTKKVPENCCTNWFDYDKIKHSLVLRNRQTKDRISVTQTGSRKLKDYLIDARMPAAVRDCWPLLADGDKIMWVPGYRMGEDYKIGEDTKLVLEAEIKWEKGLISQER